MVNIRWEGGLGMALSGIGDPDGDHGRPRPPRAKQAPFRNMGPRKTNVNLLVISP